MESRPRIKDHSIRVTSVIDLTPWYRRVTFDPQGLFDMYDPAPGAYLQLSVPAGHDGNLIQRSYTVRTDADTGLCFDFVLHDPSGPGSQWAAGAHEGMALAVTEPPYHLEIPDVGHALLIGDATAIPALSSIVESLPPHMSAAILIEDSHPDHDQIPLPTRENITLAWLDHCDESSMAHAGTADLSDCFLWAAGERTLAKTAKSFSRTTLTIPRENVHIQTYWIA